MFRTTARFHIVLLLGVLCAASLPLFAATDGARFSGKPTFSEGKALGYFVWKEGDTWKVRWTTFGADHRFTGTVTVEGGEFKSLKRIDVDTERKVIAPGRQRRVVVGPRGRARVTPGRGPVVSERVEDRIEQENEHLIRFVTRTDDDIDGFDFKVGDATQLIRFVLEIDGKTLASEVEIGAANFKPNEDPLVARLR